MNESKDLPWFRDANGQIRRCGSLTLPEGFVSAYRTFEDEHPVYEDDEIRELISDPKRVAGRKMFGPEWVMDQKQHGSCNGYAAAAALSKARWIRGIRDRLLLSGAYVYSKINGHQDRGSVLEDGMEAIQKYGACPLSLVGSEGIYPEQQPRNADTEAAKHKGLACWAVQTKQGFRTALAMRMPVIVAVQAGTNFQRLGGGGIAGVSNGMGNHAVHCDDILMVNGVEVYDHQNSWNTSYGQSGRSYLTWDHFDATFKGEGHRGMHLFYAIGSTEEAE